MPVILSALDDQSPAVRSAAAAAAAQASAGGNTTYLFGKLKDRLQVERDSEVRKTIATSIGRMTYLEQATVRDVETTLLAATSSTAAVPADAATLEGSLRGFEALTRLRPRLAELTAVTRAWLGQVVRRQVPAGGSSPVARRLALQTLLNLNLVESDVARDALADEDEHVRRLAAQAIAAAPTPDATLVRRAAADTGASVRYALLRDLARREDAVAQACRMAVAAERDASRHVALLALDVVGTRCEASAETVSLLAQAVATLPDGSLPVERLVGWHRGSHALVSLARLDAARAAPAIDAASRHPVWQVRMYAARASGAARASEIARRLARDANANVREAAIAALSATEGHAADGEYLAALGAADYQLLITAAEALKGTAKREEALPPLLDALDRVTAARRETSRDARRALLDRIGELGSADVAPRISPYVADFDETIASAAAALLSSWSGVTIDPSPRPLPRQPVPTADELVRVGRARASVHMADGRSFEVTFRAGDAPLNAYRFVRLAQAGYYDGLTFHRVVPAFVIQGGSPGANEYMGDGPFSRDEVGVSNLRGSVGLSTRGRDTGDAQFYVNLVDNYRLDHTYTVFGEITRGMDVVDEVVEGDVIARVEVRW